METRLKPATGIPTSAAANATGSANPPTSQQAWGGMLCPNESYGMAACIDGTSNTMIVSEMSDYFYSNHNGTNTGFRIRIDPSYGNGGSSAYTGGWWWLGTNNGYTSSQGTANWVKAYGVNTVRAYSSPAPVNTSIGFNGKNVKLDVGNSSSSIVNGKQGIGQIQQNNPLISAHPNVVLGVFVDGHTQSIARNTPPPTLKRLVTRDDGQQVQFE
jgi:hypothetical protein